VGRLGMLLRSLAPIAVYYAADWASGLRAAIVASTLWSMGEVVVHLVRREPLDAMFKFTAITTFLFGVVDLVCTQPWLFSYEPVVTNVVTAGFLLALANRSLDSLLDQVYQARPELRGDPEVPVRMRVAVVLIAAFTLLKAVVYLWMAMVFPVERAMNLRVIVGNASLVVLVVVMRFGIDPALRLARRLGWVSPELPATVGAA
jgi:intracellular septation protein A